MGTGKSVAGKILAEKLGRKFVDMDTLIEEREGVSIADIFAGKGEPYFRGREKELVGELAKQEGLVVSCGGGVVCDPENLGKLKQTGVIFALKASAAIIYRRTKNYSHRPILNVDNPEEKIDKLLKDREAYYARADYSIDTDALSPEETAGAIIAILNHG